MRYLSAMKRCSGRLRLAFRLCLCLVHLRCVMLACVLVVSVREQSDQTTAADAQPHSKSHGHGLQSKDTKSTRCPAA